VVLLSFEYGLILQKLEQT